MVFSEDAPPVCPLGTEACPVLAAYLRLQEECRRLLALSQTDGLTGLYNRGYLMDALSREMERTRRTGLATGLLMIDLDLFKEINDTFGHQVGDAALVWISRFLQQNVRQLDIPCRYGGEEFAIILPGTRLSQAVRLARRLHRALQEAKPRIQGHTLRLTASFGVDAYDLRERLTPAELLQRADAHLLEAKARGRNLVWHWQLLSDQASPEVSPEERTGLLTPKNLRKKISGSK
ncbi:MAG: GGDEF domain-containing protein [Deltaproteobacteria bacterium]|nr:GGDEF domain-containing protein [Deltaproteobacteria bacterium]